MAAKTQVNTDSPQTLSNKTLTAPTLNNPTIATPTISAPALSGTVTGTYTLGGTPSIGAHAVTGPLDLSGASAGQLIFPATQNASAGTNTLDDYEEGTWTPTVGGSSTYTLQSGRYTKIGNTVFLYCAMAINTIGTGSAFNLSGLPFTPLDTMVGPVFFSGAAVTTISAVAEVDAGVANIHIYGLSAANASQSQLAFFGNGTSVTITITFRVAT